MMVWQVFVDTVDSLTWDFVSSSTLDVATPTNNNPWSDTLIIPLCVGSLSMVTLLLSILWESGLGRAVLKTRPLEAVETRSDSSGQSTGHITKHGDKAIFAFKITRLIGCLVLLGISTAALILDVDEDEDSPSPSSRIKHHRYLQSGMCGLFFYATLLAISSLSFGVRWNRATSRHLNTVMLCTFLVYFFRDVFPLATFSLAPKDLWEGQLLWPKVMMLFAVSVIIPVAIPRQYIPLDPKKPMTVVNPEQTASIFSIVFYFFLDPIIALAYRIPHLDFEQLPPLCDYDDAAYLKAKAFPYLDVFASKERRHVFFGFIWIFRWKILSMAVLLVIAGLSNFVSPLAINKLLAYLEDPNANAFMKPWFWILLLFLGPLAYTLTFELSTFIGIRIEAHIYALVMQLVFEHALRIRVKAETAKTPHDAASGTSSDKASANLAGKINTLLTVDRNNIGQALDAMLLVLVPIQVVGSVVFLYQLFGWSAFVGMGAMLALFPLPGYLAKMQSSVQNRALEKTDARVQIVSETMSVLRMIKMLGWEKQVHRRIAEKRQEELTWVWWRKVLMTASFILNSLVPIATMLVTYAPQTVIMKEDLSAAKVFSSIAVFDILRSQLWLCFVGISRGVKGKVSLDRLNDFLQNTELLDSFTSKDITVLDEPTSELIGFRDAMFTWSNDEQIDGALTPSSRRFILKIEGELFFKPGFNIVVGPTGSGKTSLLMALLGEMYMIPSSPASWFNLPRTKGVSYAAQESWVLNDTIKNNILFNTPMDAERYKKVLYQCCLERDLELFDAGDETEVGEKGLTLSGGQKARVTLARAIYADTQVLLLDDILAALDVHTAKWIVEKCLTGDLIRNRTVILVTHNVALTSKIADFVVSVGLDGRVHIRDSVSDALAKDEALTQQLRKDQAILETAAQEIDSTPSADGPEKSDGKLIMAEEIEYGHVSWDALNMFFSAHSAGKVFLFFTGLTVVMLLTALAGRFETWYMGYWASQYGKGTPVPVFKYIVNFSLIVLVDMIVTCLAYIYFSLGSFNASKEIHTQLLNSIVGTTFRWLDTTPTSRITARFTADIDAIDDSLSEGFWDLTHSSLTLLTRLLSIVIFTPLFFIPGAVVGIVGICIGRIYMASQLSVKRELSNARAPVLGHIGATIGGLASVRAYNAQDTSIQISIDQINRLTRLGHAHVCKLEPMDFYSHGSVLLVMDSSTAAIANCHPKPFSVLFSYTTSLAYYMVYFQSHRPSNTGFTLNMAIGFSGSILNWVRCLERVKQYIEIEQEAKATLDGVPPAYWPANGSISVDNLSARYSPDGPKVLHDISFNIRSGERVGIVGRTGSGKSSLTLALLRCIFTEGTVYYDGLSTSALNLDALRANITVIPQVPELVAGSLRSNLDPFGQLDDAVLNDALRAAGLSALQEELEDGKLTLDSEIAAGGSNLSVGQRQIIALGRAIVRGSKLLILDEATSAIDYKTDAIIQTSLRTELPKDTTCLIVAHRLQSVMDADKIIVLDAGHIVEFDSPKVLLKNEQGMLRALVDGSGDKDTLYQIVVA
ncbi:ATP-binding cassette transporter [Mycena venus]|uniref:ATP-binding cassette transporter n=1 Tax=Mycena venus TaxID=2733690 RepID=A0A8H6Z1X5_9AGAR|nr:ATP-binding cassette transporter [Mycena venus]